jgi:amino acid adenylation domain-containing protein
MQVENFLEQSARVFPDKIALVCGDKRFTYRQIDLACNRLAHALIKSGVERGDRVAVYLDNTVEAVISIFAILKAGGVFLMVNPTTKAEKLVFILNDSRAAVLIAPGRKLMTLAPGLDQAAHLRGIVGTGPGEVLERPGSNWQISFDEILNPNDLQESSPAKRCIDIDLAALIYTSGSTGTPKGVMMTHLNIVSAATSITTYLENSSEDIILNVLPLSFDYGLYQILMGFKVGGTVILERSFTYPHAVLERIVREKATGFPIVPTISAILLQMDLKKYDLSSLRYISNTGAALPTRHIVDLRGQIPNVKVYSMYGLTECKRVSYLPPDQLDIRPASVGKGMPNEEVYIVDEKGNRVGPGIEGELVIRGSNVMKGYWERPEETARVLKPGPVTGEKVLYSGDLFRMDDEGYLYFVGRKDDIIKTRGEKVSPKEVENALYNLDGVAEAAVIAVADSILGQAIKAVITLREGVHLTEQDILRHCSQHLEDFMVPKFVELRDSLPKTATGKINKRELGIPSGEKV